ncbi:MAG: hemolysin family protein [Planctomycetota bacterium]
MFELLIILLLVLVNALLSGSEMAVVSARRGKLQASADGGSRSAKAVLRLRGDPEQFLATVQVGITLVGAIAGAFGGSAFAGVLTPLLARIPGCAEAADEIAFGVVVALITYLSVVFGELIPKSLALRHAEPIAMAMARPVQLLELLARPLIWLLVKSSNLVLRPFHDSTNFVESKLTRDDLAAMVSDATSQSDLTATTRQVLQRAIDFSGARVADVMVPRRWAVVLPKSADEQAIRHALLVAGHRRVPVYETAVDEIVGYVLREDVMALLWDKQPLSLAPVVRPPYFVPETMPADRALRELQARRLHLAIVVDEAGSFSGLVTLEDLLEELVGEIFNERDVEAPNAAKREADGAWLAPGLLGVREFHRLTGIDLDAPEDVRTIGGLMVHLAGGSLPAQGAVIAMPGVSLEAVEVSARRVRSVRVRRAGR